MASTKAGTAADSMWWLAQGEGAVAAGLDWLSPREQARLASFRYTKRRIEFLARRWAAKHAVAEWLQREDTPGLLAGIDILNHASGAPYVLVDGRELALEISISDRAGWAVCALGTPDGDGGALGIDLELVEPRSAGFVDDFFTAREAAWVRQLPAGDAHDEAANLIWSAKEAALKVLKIGLRADTREVEVSLSPTQRSDGWAALSVSGPGGAVFPGWWRRDGMFLVTLAGQRALPPPARLSRGGNLATAAPLHSWLAQPRV